METEARDVQGDEADEGGGSPVMKRIRRAYATDVGG